MVVSLPLGNQAKLEIWDWRLELVVSSNARWLRGSVIVETEFEKFLPVA